MSVHHATTIDTSAPGVPMARLVRVEMRKLIDTRAGFWLLATMFILVMLVVTAMFIIALHVDEATSWFGFLTFINGPLGFLLPVFGIMTVTSEWGQRTALITFTIEPRRHRTVLAKLLAGAIWAVLAVLVSMALGALANVLYDVVAGDVSWNVTLGDAAGFAFSNFCGFLLGFGFGMLIPNTAVAIVVLFVFRYIVPNVLMGVAAIWEWFGAILPWLNWLGALELVKSGQLSGQDFAHVVSSLTLWLVLPLVGGSYLLMRREIS